MTEKTALEQIQELYAEIPEFECIPGCTDCCGPVPFALAEWNQVEDKRKPFSDSLDCPYSVEHNCGIYNHRPFICRLYGTADDPRLKRPHGKRPINLLSREKARELTAEYTTLMNKP